MPDVADPALSTASPVAGPRGDCHVSIITNLPMTELVDRMTPARARMSVQMLEWLTRPEQNDQPGHRIADLCNRVVAAGIPLDRYGSSTSMVTAEHDAIGRLWLRGEEVTESLYVRPEEDDPVFLSSPFHESAETGRWVELWLPDTPDGRFGVVPSLKALGLTHYLCVPYVLDNGANSWITLATKQPTGFSEQDLLFFAFMLPVLTMRIDGRLGWSTLDKLLRTYVGDEPHKAILAGRAKRGQVSTIRAAMLVADLRDSTGHTADLSAVQAVDLFNDLFDCLVPAIEERSGEVLKYLGDGLLAIFRESKSNTCDAADRALAAAQSAFAKTASFNREHPDRRPMHIGIALHYGEIAYGNVGSGLRLDFTVIGRDVALATRIAEMNARLGQPLLLSATFVDRIESNAERVGVFAARGFAQQVEVFRPARQTERSSPSIAPMERASS